MNSAEDQPERVLALRVPACEPTNTPVEHRRQAERLWQDLLVAAQRAVPGAITIEPGYCVMRARGPTRYYGSETAAASALLQSINALLTDSLRVGVAVGVASGRFAAIQAAKGKESDPYLQIPLPGVHLVERAHTADFLSGLPIACATSEDLTAVLVSLGIHTLGAFAALPEQAVHERFGSAALAAQRRARGLGEPHRTEVEVGAPARDLSVSVEFEPPLAGIDQLAFACSGSAEQFVHGLRALDLVCTELRVELIDDTATSHARSWSHPTNFTAVDIVNRVRWQAATLPLALERGGAGIATVRFEPERTALAAAHEPGLWNNAPTERVHHQLTRVQSLVGPDGVGTGAIVGGRTSSARQQFTPWGERRTPATITGPWPGQLLGPLPNLLCPDSPPVALLDEHSARIVIDADELFSGIPAYLHITESERRRVRGWSAPWPLQERWWLERNEDTLMYRMQIECDDGSAWLLRYTSAAAWAVEGRYS